MAEHDEIEIEDGSNDRAYFTLVPNIILNHSTATDQALYLQMKRFAGEKRGGAYCTASEKTLMAKLHIGREALKKSLAYLLEREWITFAGEKTVWTEGGPQKVKTYRVNDIWKMNVEHYKGVADSAPLKNKGVAETDKGVSKTAQGVAETAPTKNYIKQIEHSALADSHEPYESQKTLEADDLDGSSGDSKSPRISGNKRKAYDELIAWSENERGFKFLVTHRTKQYAAFRLANKNGITREQLMERWEEMAGETFWQKNGFDWMNVVTSFNTKPA
jgi:hypothetical protein